MLRKLRPANLSNLKAVVVIYFTALCAFVLFSGCSSQDSSPTMLRVPGDNTPIDGSVPDDGSGGGETGGGNPGETDGGTIGGGGTVDPGAISICSKLSLSGVIWPASLEPQARNSLALALNLSGSFEGSSGWANLTNNFDGMGLSMGLLNQTLGTSSLQPLWIKMRDRSYNKMQSLFSASHFTSALGMLARFENTAGDIVEMEDADPVNHLDIGQPDRAEGMTIFSAASDSVSWAKSTIYTDGGTTFQPTWKSELKAMAASPEYVSLQIEAALTIHNRAMKYMATLGMTELRSYLMLFDINVQNGSLYQADIDAYKAYFATRPTATETQKLTKILELRLTHVKSQWVNDVRSRKTAIINGTGTVHGQYRDFQREYCFQQSVRVL